jgi:hypothetical protein
MEKNGCPCKGTCCDNPIVGPGVCEHEDEDNCDCFGLTECESCGKHCYCEV